jgi:hypothetical protein
VEIFSACPFAVSTLPWEPAPGRRSLCVAVKATFALTPGLATIAALQEPFGAEMRDVEAGPAALGDLVPFKPRADILLAGHAYAPRGAPTDGFVARARVGAVRKALSITGDRSWVPSFDGLRPSVAVPFRRMALRYDRAVRTGENLGGVDIIAQGAELGRSLPNIAAIADQGGETPGFGPLPLPWRARRYGLGDAALMWASRVALSPGPPPPGFDFRLFNAAPSEQQLDDVPVGVEIQLENLHPEHARLDTRLPPMRLKLFRRAPRSERSVEVPMRCDTLWIDTDRGLCFALWRGAVLVEGPDESTVGRLVIAAEPEGDRLGVEHADRLLARLAPPVTYVDATAAFGEPGTQSGSRPPLDGPGPAPVSYPPPPPAMAPAEPPREAPIEHLTPRPVKPITLVPVALEGPASVALPFRQPPTGFEVPAQTAPIHDSYPPPPPPGKHGSWPSPGWVPPRDDDGEQTPPRGYLPVPDPTHAAHPTSPPFAEPERTARGTLRPPPAPPPPVSEMLEVDRTARGTLRPPASVANPPALDRTATGTIRPPMSTPPPALDRTATGTIRPPASTPPAALPAPPLPPVPPPMHYPELPLEVYCAVKNEAWRTGAPLREVLGQRGIEEGAFRAHEQKQADALGREAAEGRADSAIALMDALRAARQP